MRVPDLAAESGRPFARSGIVGELMAARMPEIATKAMIVQQPNLQDKHCIRGIIRPLASVRSVQLALNW